MIDTTPRFKLHQCLKSSLNVNIRVCFPGQSDTVTPTSLFSKQFNANWVCRINIVNIVLPRSAEVDVTESPVAGYFCVSVGLDMCDHVHPSKHKTFV